LHIPIFHIFPFPEIKLLKVVKRRGAEPGVHGGGTVLEKVRRDAEAAAGARVGGEDEGDRAGDGLVGGGKLLEALSGKDEGDHGLGVEVRCVEDERGGEPDVAPPGGEDLGATGFLSGEKRNYLTEDGVGEAADAVDVVVFAAAAAATTTTTTTTTNSTICIFIS